MVLTGVMECLTGSGSISELSGTYQNLSGPSKAQSQSDKLKGVIYIIVIFEFAMSDSLQNLVLKLERSLPQVKARTIKLLYSKINYSLLTPQQLSASPALAEAVLNWINDFQDKQSKQRLTEAVLILLALSRTLEGSKILSQLQARQFLQAFGRYLVRKFADVKDILQIIFTVNQNITALVGQKQVQPIEPQRIEVRQDMFQESSLPGQIVLLELPHFSLSEGDQKVLNDIQVQLKYTQRRKLAQIVESIHMRVKDLPPEIFFCSEQFIGEICNLHLNQLYQLRAADIISIWLSRLIESKQLYLAKFYQAYRLSQQNLTYQQERYYPSPQPYYSPGKKKLSAALFRLVDCLQSPLSLKWVRLLRHLVDSNWIAWFYKVGEKSMSVQVRKELGVLLLHIKQADLIQHSLDKSMRRLFKRLFDLQTIGLHSPGFLVQKSQVIKVFCLEEYESFQMSVSQTRPIDLQEGLDRLLRKQQKQVLLQLINSKDQDLRVRVIQSLMDLIQNEKQVDGEASSELLFTLFTEDILTKFIGLGLQGKSIYHTLELIQLLWKFGRQKEEAQFYKQICLFLFSFKTKEEALNLKANKLAKLLYSTEYERTQHIVNLFSRNKRTQACKYLFNRSQLDYHSYVTKQHFHDSQKEVQNDIGIVKNPIQPIASRIKACDRIIGSNIKANFLQFQRYCSYELRRLLPRLQNSPEQSQLFLRLGMLCKDVELPLQVYIALYSTPCKKYIQKPLKKAIFLSLGGYLLRHFTDAQEFQLDEFQIQILSPKPLQLNQIKSDQSPKKMQEIVDLLNWFRRNIGVQNFPQQFNKSLIRQLSIYFSNVPVSEYRSVLLSLQILRGGDKDFSRRFNQFCQQIMLSSYYQLGIQLKYKRQFCSIISLLTELQRLGFSLQHSLKKKLSDSKFFRKLGQLAHLKDLDLSMQILGFCFSCSTALEEQIGVIQDGLLQTQILNFQQSSLCASFFTSRLISYFINKALGKMDLKKIGQRIGWVSKHIQSALYQVRAASWILLTKLIRKANLQQFGWLYQTAWNKIMMGENKLVYGYIALFVRQFCQSIATLGGRDQQTFADRFALVRQKVRQVVAVGFSQKIITALSNRFSQAAELGLLAMTNSLLKIKRELGGSLCESEMMNFIVSRSSQSQSLGFVIMVWEMICHLIGQHIKAEYVLSCTKIAESIINGLNLIRRAKNTQRGKVMSRLSGLLKLLLRESADLAVFVMNKLSQQKGQPEFNVVVLMFKVLSEQSSFELLQLVYRVCLQWKDPTSILEQQGVSQGILSIIKGQWAVVQDQFRAGPQQGLGSWKKLVKVTAFFASCSDTLKQRLLRSQLLKNLLKLNGEQVSIGTSRSRKSGRSERCSEIILLLKSLLNMQGLNLKLQKTLIENSLIWQSFQRIAKICLAEQVHVKILFQAFIDISLNSHAVRVLGKKVSQAKLTLLSELLIILEQESKQSQLVRTASLTLQALFGVVEVRTLLLRNKNMQSISRKLTNSLQSPKPNNSYNQRLITLLSQVVLYQEFNKRLSKQLLQQVVGFVEGNIDNNPVIAPYLTFIVNLASAKQARQVLSSLNKLLSCVFHILSYSPQIRLGSCVLYNLMYKNYAVLKKVSKNEVRELLQGRAKQQPLLDQITEILKIKNEC